MAKLAIVLIIYLKSGLRDKTSPLTYRTRFVALLAQLYSGEIVDSTGIIPGSCTSTCTQFVPCTPTTVEFFFLNWQSTEHKTLPVRCSTSTVNKNVHYLSMGSSLSGWREVRYTKINVSEHWILLF